MSYCQCLTSIRKKTITINCFCMSLGQGQTSNSVEKKHHIYFYDYRLFSLSIMYCIFELEHMRIIYCTFKHMLSLSVTSWVQVKYMHCLTSNLVSVQYMLSCETWFLTPMLKGISRLIQFIHPDNEQMTTSCIHGLSGTHSAFVVCRYEAFCSTQLSKV